MSYLFHVVVTNYIATSTSSGDVIRSRHSLFDILLLTECSWDSTVPWLRQSVISLSPSPWRSRFDSRPVGHRVNRIALAQNFLHVPWLFPITSILPMLHTHLFIYHWHCIILVTKCYEITCNEQDIIVRWQGNWGIMVQCWRARAFSLVQSIQTNSEVHPASYVVGTRNPFLRELTQDMKLTIQMLRLSMNDAILTLPICLNGMHRGSFTLTFITSWVTVLYVAVVYVTMGNG